MKICSVIIAGGSGSRLWPISRSMRPKQFLKLTNENTMLQSTIKRLEPLKVDSTIIICNEEHRFFVSQQIAEMNLKNSKIILEPEGRNTAPAVTLAALQCDENTLLIVSSADHEINNKKGFVESLSSAIRYAEKGKFVTFGVTPDKPHVGYGYIKKGEKNGPGFIVDQFVEKPNLDKAKEYLNSGEYLWNSGIFMFCSKSYIKELKKFNPEIYKHCKASLKSAKENLGFIKISSKDFLSCPDDSIDYAIMEKTKNSYVIPLASEWSDIGSWESLWEDKKKNGDNNFISGDAIVKNVKNSLIISNYKLTTALGLEDIVIVSTKDSVLVTNKNSSQNINLILDELKLNGREETLLDREVYRPWGKYDSIDNGESFQVKRITVNPGEKLSIQRHKYRSEHWIVVEGKATVTQNDKEIELDANESTYIPVGMIHALENKEKTKLILIEIQTGTYFGEDDIERFDDIYGRE